MSLTVACQLEKQEWMIELTNFYDYGSHYFIKYTEQGESSEFYFGKAQIGWFIVIPSWNVSVMITSVYAKADNIRTIHTILEQNESVNIASTLYEYARMIDIDESHFR